MRKISEMYRQSGGTNWMHKCKECQNFLGCKNSKRCDLYLEAKDWNGNHIACKFFVERTNECIRQMNIFDYL